MAFEVTMPRLGWNMEVGALAAWRKQDGEAVEAGEILFEVESDKAVQEVEALESGVLRIPPESPALGEQVAVGTVLAYLVKPGEGLPFQAKPATAATAPGAPQAPAPAPRAKTPRREGRKQPAISPRAARVAAELGVSWKALKGSGRTGRIVERDVRLAASHQAAPVPEAAFGGRVSPVARRVAEELGVDLTQLAAQQPGKRIERADVEAAAQRAAARPEPVGPRPAAPVEGRTLPISQVRRVTAERMAAAAHTTAAVTLTTEADATELVRLRQQLKDNEATVVPSYNDLMAKLAAQALTEHPQVNARFEGESIVQPASVNIGIAVDTPDGLLVPVIRDVGKRDAAQLRTEVNRLKAGARERTLPPADLRDFTIMLSNFGVMAGRYATPVVVPPAVAILGSGRISRDVVVTERGIEAHRRIPLSLTFDHRCVTGGEAVRFLAAVIADLQLPT